MSASICRKCEGGYIAYENQDGDFACLSCGHVVYRNVPLDIPKGRPADRDRLSGTKPKRLSLAPNPGGAKG